MQIDADSQHTAADGPPEAVDADASGGAWHERRYGVKLDVFEGPLDLLLYLIRKNEVDIYDIPVSTITAEYLQLMGSQLRFLDLQVAGDFILMAATLMKIKSQMLLPREVDAAVEGEADPRAELVRRLLEYQQFKEIADWLHDQGLGQRDLFAATPDVSRDTDGAEMYPVSLFDLLKVYKHVLDHVPRLLVHRILEEELSVEECIDRLLSELGRRSRLRFFDLVEGGSRQSLVANFVGILELLKSQRIRVQQAAPFEDIWIERRTDGDPSLVGPITSIASSGLDDLLSPATPTGAATPEGPSDGNGATDEDEVK